MVSHIFSLKQLSIPSTCSEEYFLQSVELERTDKARGARQSWHTGIILFLLLYATELLQIMSFVVLLTPFHLSHKHSPSSSNDTARSDKSRF